jgi:DNA-binding NarL/FixJ family response regulator
MNQETSRAGTPKTMQRPIRVLLAEDHAVMLWGLRQLLESACPRMAVSGTARSCTELLSHPALGDTDVVLLDLGLRDANALGCLQQLVADAGLQVVVLTGDLNAAHHRDAVMRGARGVVLKSQPTDAVIEAVERVHAGHVSFDGALMSTLLDSLPGMVHTAHHAPRSLQERQIDSLTPKERQVIHAIVEHRGAKSLTVAEDLHMSEHTLRNHLTTIYSKLGVQGRLNLYVFAIEHGLAPAPAAPAPAPVRADAMARTVRHA